ASWCGRSARTARNTATGAGSGYLPRAGRPPDPAGTVCLRAGSGMGRNKQDSRILRASPGSGNVAPPAQPGQEKVAVTAAARTTVRHGSGAALGWAQNLGPFLFQPLDRVTQPGFDGFFELNLIVTLIQSSQGIAFLIYGNVGAGHGFISGIFRNESVQQALVAGMHSLRLAEIQAGERILKHRGRLPGRAHRAAVAAVFQEAEFELQNFQQVAI